MKKKLVVALLVTANVINLGHTVKGENLVEVERGSIPTAGITYDIDMCVSNCRVMEEEKIESEVIQAEVDKEQYNWREEIKNTAEGLIGQIKYSWGIKPTMEEWTIEQGLDCSGFIEYVYNIADVDYEGCLESTYTISVDTVEIDKSELEVGDLGMIMKGGSYYINSLGQTNYTGDFDGDGEEDLDIQVIANHVGIYMGTDENGNELWCHCNAKDGNVVVNNYDKFQYYFRVSVEDRKN